MNSPQDSEYLNLFGELVTNEISATLSYWDNNLICRFANRAFFNWFKMSPEEVVGKIVVKDLLGPLYQTNLPHIELALAGKRQTFENELLLPDGKKKYSLVNYYPHILNGEVKGFFVYAADLTHLKSLEMEVARVNAIVIDQNKRLLNFANIVTHNLKTYAFNLKEILGFFIKAESEAEKLEMLAYLESISNGFTSTVNNLNEIVESHNLSKIKSSTIVLYDYIENVTQIIKRQITLSNTIIENKVSKDTTLNTNPAYIESIILNFITNAIKYKQIESPPKIEISTDLTEKELKLIFKDNGRGINLDKHKDDLFGMYKTFHGNMDATGIGLFITKFQVESMGGRIQVESQENFGTTFTVFLPLIT